MPEKLTVKESADLLGVSVPTVYNLLKKHQLKPIEDEKKTLLNLEDVQKYGRENGLPRIKKGLRLRIINKENPDKKVWLLDQEGVGKPPKEVTVESPFIGIVDQEIEHNGVRFIYMTLENGETKWCVLSQDVRSGFFEEAKEEVEIEEKEVIPEEELPKEKTEIRKDLDKLIEDDHLLWDITKKCSNEVKEFIKEKGNGSDTVGYSVHVGAKEVIYQPEIIYNTFEWSPAIAFFIKERKMIWDLLKEKKLVTQDVINEVERVKRIKEEIKIR